MAEECGLSLARGNWSSSGTCERSRDPLSFGRDGFVEVCAISDGLHNLFASSRCKRRFRTKRDMLSVSGPLTHSIQSFIDHFLLHFLG